DPAGIKALLEQLRSSQAWQESIGADSGGGIAKNSPPTSTTPQVTSSLTQAPASTSDVSNSSSSVADLLSQLNSSEWIIPSRPSQASPSHFASTQQTSLHLSQAPSQSTPQPPENSAPQPAAGIRASTHGQDLRMMSFQQALPHLTQLTENANFVAAIARLREEQKDLERQLWEERLAIHKKHENKVKVAQTKAGLIGAGISRHEADMLNDAFRKELQKFDAERVLFAWDGLLQKQQSTMEALGIPTMFPTDLRADREVSSEATTKRRTSLTAALLEATESSPSLGRCSGVMKNCEYFCSMCLVLPFTVLSLLESGLQVPSALACPLPLVHFFSRMPYIDIPSRDDYVSIWYTTNSDYGNVGSFDPERPTCILLHPLFLDSSWLIRHFDDPRLSQDYNLIAFDQRTCGRSRCRPSQWHDSYVDAADLAMVCQALLLPPAHILAFEGISVNAALRLAALWPEQVLSLTLCDVPPPTELQWVFHAYDELLQLWCYAPDLDSFEHAGNEVVTFMTQEVSHSSYHASCWHTDELIAYWEKYTPPTKRLRIVELVNIMMNRTLLKPEELASITCPVLIIQGESSQTAPLKYAEKLKQHLINAKDATRLTTFAGAKACLNIHPGSASIVNQVFSKFLAQQPRTRSDLLPARMSIRDRSEIALSKLAEYVGDPSIAHRDPRSSLSFSCVKPDVAKSQMENLLFYAKDLDAAYCPLGRDGRPMRKYSERKKEAHWFQGDRHGNSYIAAHNFKGYKLSNSKSSNSPERPVAGSLTTNKDSLVTDEVAQDGRMRRTTYNASSVDKHVIKGTMQKVVTSAHLPKGIITKAMLPS
ncbi:Alpha/Beta hydrolase protein, partial [Suillus ampliporus]